MADALEQGFEVDPIEIFLRMGEAGGIREEVVAMASRVKSMGHQTAIVTNNAREFRDRWVSLVPIDAICHEIVDSSEIGLRKPDPRIFDRALEITGSSPERIIYVGDNYYADIIGAKNAGLRPVLLDEKGVFPDAGCTVIGRLGDLMEIVIR